VEPWEETDIDGLLASLSRWAGDQRAADAASGRAREHSLRQQAGEAATLAGVLVDLTERQAEVIIGTEGRVHQGSLRGVGKDVAVLENASGAVTLVAMEAIRTLQLAPPAAGLDWSGSRPPAGRLSLAGLLDALAADQAPVRVELRDGKMVTGSLRSIGVDVVTIRVEGQPGRTVHIPLRAIASCGF
jgi:hypothetical protein